MFRYIMIAVTVVTLQASTAQAITVTAGETIRGRFDFPTAVAQDLTPSSFLLRLSSADLFGNGDAVGIRLLDSGLNTLSLSQFAPGGTGLDPTVGIPFDLSDFLPGVIGAMNPPKIPKSGFVEIVGLAGSFDVTALDIFGTEQIGALNVFRQDRVSEFEQVITAPSQVPLPSTGLLLLAVLAGLFGMRRPHA